VRSYEDWLKDSEYPPPTCGICKEKLQENEMNEVVRLLCLGITKVI
jgi:hypothetical protein